MWKTRIRAIIHKAKKILHIQKEDETTILYKEKLLSSGTSLVSQSKSCKTLCKHKFICIYTHRHTREILSIKYTYKNKSMKYVCTCAVRSINMCTFTIVKSSLVCYLTYQWQETIQNRTRAEAISKTFFQKG